MVYLNSSAASLIAAATQIGEEAHPAPATTKASAKPNDTPYIPWTEMSDTAGYDATSTSYYDAPAVAPSPLNAQGYLQRGLDPNNTIYLWITDVIADFTLNGSYGQSRMLREFFPRNFQDVTIQIIGNVASSRQNLDLGYFIRRAQWLAVANAMNSTVTQSDLLVTFCLYDVYGYRIHPQDGLQQPNGNYIVKGSHKPWSVSGYIQSYQVTNVAGQVAPQFTINFLVAESNEGLWHDSATSQGSQLESILKILDVDQTTDSKVATGPNWVQDPITAANALAKKKKVAAQKKANAGLDIGSQGGIGFNLH